MCIRVCIHRTSAEHDKRFCAVLNPATGYTVLSPFQDPDSSSCKSPCINRPERSPCPWHAGCCSFDEYHLCSEPQSCNMSVNYHHFLSVETPSFSVGVLRAYIVDPSFLSHVVRFFKVGVELNLALAKLPELRSELDRLHSGLSDSNTAANKANIASRWYHYQHIKLSAAAFLAQLAIHWDRKSTTGLWPLRPGRESIPEMNICNDTDAHLKIISCGKTDNDPRGEWPHIFKQSPNFIESLPPDTSPNLVPWVHNSKSGSYQSVTDISYDCVNTGISALTLSATEPITLKIETPERQRPQSPTQTSQKQCKHETHDCGQTSTSHQRPQRPATPATSHGSEACSNDSPRNRRQKLPRRDLKRSYRRFLLGQSKRRIKRRPCKHRPNKRASPEPTAPLNPSFDVE
ncbi:hypothetical protein F4803DRAFT_412139 [Xylaria telfairii]|nr:hypothetical protein F4803DRAFT_412139 [Xylaria telfairii]